MPQQQQDRSQPQQKQDPQRPQQGRGKGARKENSPIPGNRESEERIDEEEIDKGERRST